MKMRPLFCFVLLTPVAIASASCVLFIGDCGPDVTADVRFDPKLLLVDSNLIVSAAILIRDEDAFGVDGDGVPIARDLTPFVRGPASSGSFQFHGYPYPSWYVAFLDTNGNARLDSGESFGVDPFNPRPGTCRSYVTAIAINRVRGAN